MRFLNARGAIAAAFMIAAFVQPSAAETIKIGVFGPFSGDAAAMGGSEKDAVSLVFQEKNAAGGIHGQQIEPVYADDSGKPEEAVNTVKRLISRDDVLLNIGSISSPASSRGVASQPSVGDRPDRGRRHRAKDHHLGQQMGVPFAGARYEARCRPRGFYS